MITEISEHAQEPSVVMFVVPCHLCISWVVLDSCKTHMFSLSSATQSSQAMGYLQQINDGERAFLICFYIFLLFLGNIANYLNNQSYIYV